jgi:8-oxo-dGTP diphosphatase
VSSSVPSITVTAAVVERDGAFLVARRPPGVHLAGLWEFPGGKCTDRESLTTCMAREIQEELGCEATVGHEIYSVSHKYPERIVTLHFFACTIAGDPVPVLGQELRWVPRSELRALEFPPADRELIAMLSR